MEATSSAQQQQQQQQSALIAQTLLNVGSAPALNADDDVDDDDDDGDVGTGRWTKAEDESLRLAVNEVGARNWKRIASDFLAGTRSDVQCLHRWQKVLRPGLVKGPWQPDEDATIRRCMENGVTRWSEIAKLVPGRIGKQCRERWFNHLDPSIKTGEWTEEEDRRLIEGQRVLGNKWSQIAKIYLNGRPENAVKNRWNAATRRRRNVSPPVGSLAAALAAQAAGSSSSSGGAALQGSAIDALSLAAASARPSAKKSRSSSPRRRGRKGEVSALVTLESLCAAALGGEDAGKPSSSKAGSSRKKRAMEPAADSGEPDAERPGSAKRGKAMSAARPPPVRTSTPRGATTKTPMAKSPSKREQGNMSPPSKTQEKATALELLGMSAGAATGK